MGNFKCLQLFSMDAETFIRFLRNKDYRIQVRNLLPDVQP